MTLTLSVVQVIERCTVTLVVASAASLPSAIIIIDGKAYTGIWTPGTAYTFTYDIALERGPHSIYAQATDSAGTVTTVPITYVMAYELSEFGIDVHSGDAKLDAIGTVLHDALLPDLPTLNFSCAVLLTGTIGAVIRERGLRQYQFTVATVGVSNGLYQYTCKAAESYALTTAIMALQTAYGSTSDAIRLLVPSLNIVNAQLLAQSTYPQLYTNITPVTVIQQLLIQAIQPSLSGGAQASVRNGNLYVFPLDVSTQIPDYHMQRLDPLTGWQRDADVYDAVIAHYVVKQFPNPSTVLTLNDYLNWTGTVSDVTQVTTLLLPPPSGALGMLKLVGNASRAGLNVAFKDYDRVRFNWCPIDTGATVTVSLQQDSLDKLELTHTFAGQIGAGFLLQGAPGVTGDTLTETIPLDDTGSGGTATKFVTTVTGTTTASCSYTVSLLDVSNGVIWQDIQRNTFGNTFVAGDNGIIPPSVSQNYQASKVQIVFTSLYLIAGNYGVQCVTCDIQVQTYQLTGSHSTVVSSATYKKNWECNYPTFYTYPQINLVALSGGQYYSIFPSMYNVSTGETIQFDGGSLPSPYQEWYGAHVIMIDGHPAPTPSLEVYVAILQQVFDYSWTSSPFVWSDAFNLFEAVDIPFSGMTRTGNPTNLQTIALTFSGDNYVDTLAFITDNPLPVIVRAGTGSRPYVVTDDFGSEAGAQQYANGLLPIVSVAREQYTRDVPHSVDLGVGDTVDCDGTPKTVYAADYRQEGKTIAVGMAMDTLMTRLQEQARRVDALERNA